MKVLLTSFGLNHEKHPERQNLFYRMPPISVSSQTNKYAPDYGLLLFTDKLIIDLRTFERLQHERHPAYDSFADTINRLHDEGLVQLEDFDSILEANKEFLELMLKRDLEEIDSWVDPLKESVSLWKGFSHNFSNFLDEELHLALHSQILRGRELRPDESIYYLKELRSFYYTRDIDIHAKDTFTQFINSLKKKKNKNEKETLSRILQQYLSYVNANLVLSNSLDTPFSDWYDLLPFYREKFNRFGIKEVPLEEKKVALKKLFEIAFPEFTFWEPKKIVKAIKDKRIEDLRNLIDESIKNEIEFDRNFAAKILAEVFGIEQRLGKLRNLVSYATLPIDFIPWLGTPLQKGSEEAIMRPIENKKRKHFRWFYFISEMSYKR